MSLALSAGRPRLNSCTEPSQQQQKIGNWLVAAEWSC